ncbi:MAG: PAS domain S-box protein [Methanobacterium sp.]|uniref:response regulator n=1 Tax=Methanobacterium sp. TaxID=2164 RepID=UPI003D65E980|nr:PAS domain S-box protein [Methanobacterium sp.]
MSSIKILVVEDESIVAMDIKNRLESMNYIVPGIISSGEEAVKKAAEAKPDLILMDIVLKGEMDGIDAAQIIKNTLDIPVVYLTAYSDENTLERAKITGPFGYIIKPFEDRELHSAIEVALYKHEMESKLKENEEKFRYLFEESQDAIFITVTNCKFQDFNPVMLDLFGYSKEEMDNLSFSNLFADPEDWEKLQETIPEKGYLKNYEFKLINKQKEEIDCIGSLTLRKDEKQDVLGYYGILHDITERKKAEEALKKSEEKYRKIVEKFLKIVGEVLTEIKS